MVFSSIIFLTCFLPLFIIIYKSLPKIKNLKHIFILFSSFLFYGWGEPRFVFLIFFTTILDFLIVKRMDKSNQKKGRIFFLVLSLCLNLGLLFYFKYFNFFIDNLNNFNGLFNIGSIDVRKIILPIGISFFTFESITYAVDVFRRIHKPLKSFWEYQMYIIFFPKLIAGPIIRYHEIADQISNHISNETYENQISGFIRFCIGLAKKVLIANVMGQQADIIFNMDLSHINTATAWIGTLAYTFQIYFDFSGYSDMAIGIGKILGFNFPENFNNPYVSESITDFWRRWHITLGAWMKNYLYIPLGGNKVTQYRLILNLFIVFVVSGLWHGASWNFVLWGIYHGLFLAIERFLSIWKIKSRFKPLNVMYSFIVVMVGWVLFRNDDTSEALMFIQKMFVFDFTSQYVFITQANFFYILIAAVFFSFCTLQKHIKLFHDKFFYGQLSKYHLVYTILGIGLYFLCIIYLSGGEFNPFIYFKF